ncbi:uncharacterized protein TRIREDRAFT_120257 [Trichoderma reesei QM6a]|uniref:Predicted protein n=2 Tax=Hypocrea jecorina TaxID=51453 RepID=G0RA87_HYPJQ|nr:uncharacterized protein TRIREDRAFT_120257 [Trichoderma reesei QM6a]EGR51819.1 predicted protein [Trichoderma reesei QM6a]ETS05186.1 CBD9-like protein [Trichoderma reesei RUT C-30]
MLLLLLSLLSPLLASATPSQYCLFGLARNEADFCVALSLYHNHSTSAHDIYLSLSVRRPVQPAGGNSSSLGWTAVGAGPKMAGSLMFVLYGDPEASAPTLSVRTVKTGHARPVLIAQDDDEGTAGSHLDVRVAQTSWTKINDDDASSSSSSSSAYVASASAVCYGCSDWPGAEISPESASQPWIWAWNSHQDMKPFSADAQLEMHSLVDGGYGHFYVDMAAATSHHADGFPAINLNVTTTTSEKDANVGTSDRPMTASSSQAGLWQKLLSRPLAHLHGFFMTTAFLLLFPLGALAIRSGSDRAFKHHWAVQAAASASALSGAVTAIVMSDRVFGSPHQIAGVAIVCLLLPLQVLLGWRHHMDFIRIFRRTWISYAHIALGFTILVSGWANLLAGLLLYGVGKLAIALVALLILFEAGGVGVWSYLAARRRALTRGNVQKETESSAAYFALEDIPESDEEDEGAEERGLMHKREE